MSQSADPHSASAYQQRVHDALAETMFRLGPMAQTVSIFSGLVLAIGLSPVVPLPRLAAWYLLLVAASLWRTRIIVQRRRIPAGQPVPDRLIARYRSGALISGLVWGQAALLTWPEFSLMHLAMTGMVLAGMTAGAVTVLTALPGTFMRFALPALLPSIVIFAAGGTLTSLTAAFLMAMFLLSMRKVEHDLSRILRENVKLTLKLARERDAAVTTVESLAEGVVRASPDGRIQYANRAACQILGITGDAGGPMLQDVLDVHDGSDGDLASRILRVVGRDRKSLDSREDHWLAGPGGDGHWVRILARPLAGAPESGRDLIVVIREKTIEHRLIQRLSYDANHDALTRLANRRVLDRALRRAVASARKGTRTGQFLVFIDLDGFKQVNDSAGHLTGDRLLSAISEAMSRVVREEDLIARVGGDEFAILVHDCDESGMERIIQDLREAVRGACREFGPHADSVGLTAGMAEIDGTLEPVDVIARADAHCYQLKARAGN